MKTQVVPRLVRVEKEFLDFVMVLGREEAKDLYGILTDSKSFGVRAGDWQDVREALDTYLRGTDSNAGYPIQRLLEDKEG